MGGLVFSCADQRALGMSMRVERSSLSQVQERLEMHKRKHEEDKTKGGMQNCENMRGGQGMRFVCGIIEKSMAY